MSFGVIGAGSPLVDYTAAVSDVFLQEFIPGGKGGTVHIPEAERNRIFSALKGRFLRTPGGAAANTISALGKLGVRSAFFGKLGDDEDGRFFRDELVRCGVSSSELLSVPGGRTGYCLSLVTPDAERTMRSNLGVSTDISPEEIAGCDFSTFNWLLSEGYMLQIPGFSRIFSRARAAGCRTALDLSSIEIARAGGDELKRLLRENIDLVLCNNDEAAALTGETSPQKNVLLLAELSPVAVLKLGREGSIIATSDGEITIVPAVTGRASVDTTAAGDHYAAGFFYGLSENAPLEKCGYYGAVLGAAIASVAGSRMPEELWKEVLKDLNI